MQEFTVFEHPHFFNSHQLKQLPWIIKHKILGLRINSILQQFILIVNGLKSTMYIKYINMFGHQLIIVFWVLLYSNCFDAPVIHTIK